MTTPLIPAGSLMFSGYGDAPAKFYSPAGVQLTQPDSAPVECGAGCDGIQACAITGIVGITGGNAPNFPLTGSGTFNFDFSPLGNFSVSTANHGAARDDLGFFYGINSTSGLVQRFDAKARVNTWSVLTGGRNRVLGIGVNGAGMIAYFGSHDSTIPLATDNVVYAWDLVGNLDLGVFASEAAGYHPDPNTIIGLTNGDVIIAWRKVANPSILKRYNAAGVLQDTYTLPGTTPIPAVLSRDVTDASFWVSYYDAALTTFSGIRLAQITTATGAVLNNFVPEDGTFEFDGPFTVTLKDAGCVCPGGLVPGIFEFEGPFTITLQESGGSNSTLIGTFGFAGPFTVILQESADEFGVGSGVTPAVSNPIKIFPKDPNATLEFSIDWSRWLGDDSIATVEWTLDPGITQGNTVFSRTVVTIWLSGGTAGQAYDVTARITTPTGRTDDRTIRINVLQR